MTEQIKAQILAIRDSGESNMFDLLRVQRIARERGFDALVLYLEENKNEYCRFILTGQIETSESK